MVPGTEQKCEIYWKRETKGEIEAGRSSRLMEDRHVNTELEWNQAK